MHIVPVTRGLQNRDCGLDTARERRVMVISQTNLRLMGGAGAASTRRRRWKHHMCRRIGRKMGKVSRSFAWGRIRRRWRSETVPTGWLRGFDIGLGIGGLPKGRVVEIYGPESSGKTTLTLHVRRKRRRRAARRLCGRRTCAGSRLRAQTQHQP